jgi:hypothetical protein
MLLARCCGWGFSGWFPVFTRGRPSVVTLKAVAPSRAVGFVLV